ncbi:MAG: Histidine kinase [Mucilaginibacter sp.]|nr:Histidine kinase [Mucilaginibacter sp.]
MSTESDLTNLNNDYLLQFITNRKFRVYRHIVLSLFLAATFLNTKDAFVEPVNTLLKVGAFFLLLLLFYLNMYLLIPKLIFKERYLAYFLWIMLLLGITMISLYFGRYYLNPYFKNPHPANAIPSFFPFVFIFFIFIAAASTIKLFQRSIVVNQRVNELETVTIQSELEQLKNQINPHFLFNTLNNANVLTQKDPQKASQVLMKLSELLRYQLYDSARQKVLLTADIHFLEDFLNLEKIRRDNFEFMISTLGDLNGVQVSPLLFITFVENAVKHNMDAENSSYVHVFFKVEHNELNFNCINSKPLVETPRKREGGLGLTNVKRRLTLLYPEKHFLYINNGDDVFSIDLKLTV